MVALAERSSVPYFEKRSKSGNLRAAVAKIKTTTSSKDLGHLHAEAQLLPQFQAVETAINDQLQALASPRLRRSP